MFQVNKLFLTHWFPMHPFSTPWKHHKTLRLYVVIMSRTSFRVNLHSIVSLNVKELLAGSRCHIWSLSDSNGIRTHNHFVRKRTLNHLARLGKWLNVWVFIYELSGCELSDSLLSLKPYGFLMFSEGRERCMVVEFETGQHQPRETER